jgi:streptogramin lyase
MRGTFITLVISCLLAGFSLAGHTALEPAGERNFYYGTVTSEGQPVAGAQVTFFHGDPTHSLTVIADDQGRFLTSDLDWQDGYSMRVRRAGWRDLRVSSIAPAAGGHQLAPELVSIEDVNEIVTQLPSNYWMNLVLEELDIEADRLEFKMQCTYCHQQGSPLTSRRQFTREQWKAIIIDMGQRSAILTKELREKLPDAYVRAYAPENVAAKLPKYIKENGPLPIPDQQAQRSVVQEWNLGGATSNQHDVMVYHPDGSIWSVDGPIDTLHKISFENNPDGERTSYKIPTGDHKPGGAYWKMGKGEREGIETYLAPHSLQYAPDGKIWLTLAMGNQLAGFDPVSETWDIVDLEEGLNPHTLRFDDRGRLWYTITATNHVGMYNPVTREHLYLTLKAPDLKTRLILWATPFIIRHADILNVKERSGEMDGVSMPMPYGIDINPVDGSIWYSQLNMSHIGRIDPDTFEITPIETPFITPRRLRFDSQGGLWVPSYAQSSLHLFNTETMEWEKDYKIPLEPLETEVPYAVYVDKENDHVWITGTQSDTMIRFIPDTEEWTIFPLPTRVTYTREIDMDNDGNFWTSHSNGPAWHVEDGIPKVTRLDPDGAPDIESSGLFDDPAGEEPAPEDVVDDASLPPESDVSMH